MSAIARLFSSFLFTSPSSDDHSLRRNQDHGRSSLNTNAMPVHLVELPGEVLHLVCEALDEADVFRLAFACRYLHQIAYPVYLARRGIGYCDGELLLGDFRSQDSLKVIRSSLLPFRIRRIILPFTNATLPTPTSTPHADLQREVLRRVERVQEVHVKFGDFKKKVSTGAERYLVDGDSNMDFGLEAGAAAFKSEWNRLTNAILHQAQCRSLLVQVDRQACRVPPEIIEEAILRGYYGVQGSIHRLFLKLHNDASRALSTSILVAPFRWLGFGSGTPKLERFHVHSSVLFHPALCGWTLSTLGLLTLTTVSFDHLQHITADTWALLLPCLAIPNLSKLSVNLCAIPTEDLYRFLARHPGIEELELGFNFPRLDPRVSLPPKTLSKVHRLSAPAEHLVVLLSSPDTSTSPSSGNRTSESTLKSVRVLYRTRRGSLFMANAMNNDLAPICFRLRSVEEVVLSLTLESGEMDWLVSANTSSGQFVLPPPGPGRDDLDSTSGDNDNESVDSPSSSTHANSRIGSRRNGLEVGMGLGMDLGEQPTSITFTGNCVTRLGVKVNQYVLPVSLVYALPKWLAAFGGKMGRFDLDTLPRSVSGGSFGARCGDADADAGVLIPRPLKGGGPFELPYHKDAFVREVGKGCPSIRRIFVNGEELNEGTARWRRITRLR